MFEPQRLDLAVAAAAELELECHRAAVVHRDHVLAARLGPADGAAGGAGQPSRPARPRRARPLPPKPPPTSGAITRTCSGSRPEQHPEDHLVLVRGLGREPDRQPAVLAELGRASSAARSGRPASRWLTTLALDHDLAAVEQVRVGALPAARDAHVRADVRNSTTSSLRRLAGSVTDRQRLVLDLDQLGGVDARLARVSASTAATMSPTKRTVSEARNGRNICGSTGMNGGGGLTSGRCRRR